MIRWLAVLLAIALAALWRLPASLLDRELATRSNDELRLANAQGSVWTGRANLVAYDPVDRRWLSWATLAWRFDWPALGRGVLGLRLSIDGRPEADIDISRHGVRIAGLALSAPAGGLLARLPDALGRAGWRGDLAIAVPELHCDWTAACDGHAQVVWLGAASELFPGRRFGDYRLSADATAEGFNLGWTTLAGDIRIEGAGRWSPPSAAEFSAVVSGDPAFLERLPSIGGRWVRPGEAPGSWIFEIRS